MRDGYCRIAVEYNSSEGMANDPVPLSGLRGLQNTPSLHRILCLPGIGPRSAELIAQKFDTWDEFLASDPAELPGRSRTKAAHVLRVARSLCEPEVPEGVRAISCFDLEWPEWLKFEGAPVLVFVRGTLPPGGSIAIVGTRRPSSFGERAVRACVESIREHVPTVFTGVVSGLARGIDTRAHALALANSLPTWAILGSGVDTPTPSENIDLAERIIAAGGGLLSEQLPGTAPVGGTLIPRNRLQVAASSKVFIAECGVPSGTLHTARYAVELGRKLIVAAPKRNSDVSSATTAGNRLLLDPSGCSATALGATGRTAELISCRLPVADATFTVDRDPA